MTKNNIKKIALEVGFDDGEIDKCQLMLERFAHLVAKHEREKCAKVCDKLSKDMTPIASMSAWSCGVMIRARGQA